MNSKRAFSLVEMLVVVAIIGVLAALLLPALNRAKASAQRTACLANLKQIGVGVLMYTDDSDDKAPRRTGVDTNRVLSVFGYKKLLQDYVGGTRTVATNAKLFVCPADRFHYMVSNGFVVIVNQPLHEQSFGDYSSYGFNGMNSDTNRINAWQQRFGIDTSRFGVAGQPIAGIRNPSRTVMVAEAAALEPFSWHKPRTPISSENRRFKDSMNTVGFVDGHVAYIKMFWKDTSASRISLTSCFIDSPPEYDYQWNRD